MSEHTPRPFGDHYLHSVRIDAFGAYSQRNIGPFEPGLNVVFGANETGKTTVSSFIGGVLFGWEDARGMRNTYKPENAKRSGTLVFSPRTAGADEVRCTRVNNPDGIKPDPNPPVLSDIDKETYRTIFSLNSDELLGLGDAADVTAHLLTAGAGTAVSPARALAGVDERIAECLSRSGNYPDSVPNLASELDRTQAVLDAAADEAVTFRKEARELAEAAPQMEEASARLAALNAEVEQLAAQCAAIERLDAERSTLASENESLIAREADLATRMLDEHDGASVLQIDDARMRSLREELDVLSEKQMRLEHELDLASDERSEAAARLSALVAGGQADKARRSQERRSRMFSALAFALPAVFAVAAVLFFVLSHDAQSSVPLVFAVVFAIAALVAGGLAPFLLSRAGQAPGSTGAELRLSEATERLDAAERHEAHCAEKLDAHASRVFQLLESSGLSAADGNIRHARALLDEAREARASSQLLDEQRASLASARAALDASMARNADEIAAAYAALGAEEGTPLSALRAEHAAKSAERDGLQERTSRLGERIGVLRTELDRAENLQAFDKTKLEHAQLAARMDDVKATFAQLLLARRLLTEAIASWEGKSQPRVYQVASELFESMTEGAWVRVQLDDDGTPQVTDSFGVQRSPLLLSLGTRQQLYLALRIALLMTAENVGRSVPIVADDILVNFDNDRRCGAARALGELARVRQVIFFTCHEEVVALMQDECAGANRVDL